MKTLFSWSGDLKDEKVNKLSTPVVLELKEIIKEVKKFFL